MSVFPSIPPSWAADLASVTSGPAFADLCAFVAHERASGAVYPSERDVFRALELTPRERVRVVLLGQDPYHDEGQAHGLCFSVKPPTRPPPSLRNVFRELEADVGVRVPEGFGDLTAWAERGMLLLNTVLTVRAHAPASHKGKGWEAVTDAVIAAVARGSSPVVFCLWGAHAREKKKAIDTSKHAVVECAHPSPLSIKKFRGSRPFSQIDDALARFGGPPFDWSLG